MLEFKIEVKDSEAGVVTKLMGYTGILTVNPGSKTFEYELKGYEEALEMTTTLKGLLKKPFQIIF